MRARYVFFLFVISLFVNAIGCQKKATEPAPVETYTSTAGAVGFDILPLQSGNGARNWLATYTDESGTTKFHIKLDSAAPSSNKSSTVSFGQGELASEVGSDPLPLLHSLQKALQAKYFPSKIQKVDTLPFEYALLGENQSRSASDAFSDDPKGNWMAAKLFLAHGKGEVFLNINPVIHKAEFSIKDSEYGDVVLGELAKVF